MHSIDFWIEIQKQAKYKICEKVVFPEWNHIFKFTKVWIKICILKEVERIDPMWKNILHKIAKLIKKINY